MSTCPPSPIYAIITDKESTAPSRTSSPSYSLPPRKERDRWNRRKDLGGVCPEAPSIPFYLRRSVDTSFDPVTLASNMRTDSIPATIPHPSTAPSPSRIIRPSAISKLQYGLHRTLALTLTLSSKGAHRGHDDPSSAILQGLRFHHTTYKSTAVTEGQLPTTMRLTRTVDLT